MPAVMRWQRLVRKPLLGGTQKKKTPKGNSRQPSTSGKVPVSTICKEIRALNSKVLQREVMEFLTELLS